MTRFRRWATAWGWRASLEGTPLSAEDAARLHMSTESNPMVITVALLLDRPLPFDDLVGLLDARLAHLPAFRARVRRPWWGGAPRWEEDRGFDVRHHVRRAKLSVGTLAALLERVSAIAETPFDRGRALWTVDWVEGLPEGPALVLRVSHAVADGLALVEVLVGLCDEGAGLAGASPPGATPAALRAGPSRLARLAGGLGGAARLALRPADPPTALRAPVGVRKCAVASHGYASEAVARAAHARGATVTALVLAAIGAAVREAVHEGAREPLGGALHAMLPVSVRHGSAEQERNAYTSVLLPIPLAVPFAGGPGGDDAEVHAIQAALSAARATVASVGGRLVGAAGVAPALATRLGLAFFSRKATLVVSSLRGPSSRVHLGGAGVRDVLAWAPSVGAVGLAFTVLSYGGRLRVCVLADAQLEDRVRRVLLPSLDRHLAALVAPPAAGGVAAPGPLGSGR
ncbi:MAG TPA: wax ester/triacylglycerol synthase family O-acyltransferase [Polyangiaceae bacterium]|nr:wax ester/triacylglycerol synthase family O-acyltransferase [Polyangiaceae bacterium]